MIEKHHIVYKSQGGLDFELNYRYLTSEDHRGNQGPHKCKATDLQYKKELQKALESTLTKEHYMIEELIEMLGLKERQAYKAFKKLLTVKGVKRKDVIFRLMGNKNYLEV